MNKIKWNNVTLTIYVLWVISEAIAIGCYFVFDFHAKWLGLPVLIVWALPSLVMHTFKYFNDKDFPHEDFKA